MPVLPLLQLVAVFGGYNLFQILKRRNYLKQLHISRTILHSQL